jgi:antirestriction protein ArdC
MLKSYTVFNIAQCDGLPDKITAALKTPNPDERAALIDEFIAATGIHLQETIDNEAFYCGGGADFITMPAFRLFGGGAHYCATLFHELIHATGHSSRLNRRLEDRFGLQSHAAEELIAELGAAFLCAEFSLQHACYIGHYLQMLEDHPGRSSRFAAKHRPRSIGRARRSWPMSPWQTARHKSPEFNRLRCRSCPRWRHRPFFLECNHDNIPEPGEPSPPPSAVIWSPAL